MVPAVKESGVSFSERRSNEIYESIIIVVNEKESTFEKGESI